MSRQVALKVDDASPVRLSAVRATEAHIARIVANVRETDRHELWTGWRYTPEQSLRYGLANSSHVWTGLANFQPFCMFGVLPVNLLCGEGNAWLIGTDEILTHQVGFLRRSRPLLRRMQAMYSVLSNQVAAENAAAVNWLTWLGFKLDDPRPFGPDDTLFHRFEWRRDDV